jgi:hypothetical protein
MLIINGGLSFCHDTAVRMKKSTNILKINLIDCQVITYTVKTAQRPIRPAVQKKQNP